MFSFLGCPNFTGIFAINFSSLASQIYPKSLRQDLSAAQLSPNVICCNAAVSCCEKASQWLMALGFLRQAMADVISY